MKNDTTNDRLEADSGDLLAAAIQVNTAASVMADRLKMLMEMHARHLPACADKIGMVKEWGYEGHHWMEQLGNYFNNVDAVDDEDERDQSWNLAFEAARKFFPIRESNDSELLLHAEEILSDEVEIMAAEFHDRGVDWPRERMQKHADDRSILIKARSILLERASETRREPSQPAPAQHAH